MHGPSLMALGVIPFAAVALVTCFVTLFFPGQILGAAYDLDPPTAEAVGLAVRMNSLATLVLVCLAALDGGVRPPAAAVTAPPADPRARARPQPSPWRWLWSSCGGGWATG